MYAQQISRYDIAPSPLNSSPAINEAWLEQTVGISLIGDLDDQLSKISQAMKNVLDSKQEFRNNIEFLQKLNTKPATLVSGGQVVEISTADKKELENRGLNLTATPKSDGNGYFIAKSDLQTAIDQTQDQISAMNSTSELTMIQVQSLVDQRKNALAMLSNLMASRNEGLMNIIRNLKT